MKDLVQVDHRSKIAQLNGKVGSFKRWKPQDVEGLVTAQRAVIVAKIEQAVCEVTADGPTLTQEDRDELKELIQNVMPREGA